MQKLSRRIFCKTGLVGAFCFTGHSIAEEKPFMIINRLIDALRSINKPACETAVTQLQLLKDNNSSYDLHLRSADLNSDDIKRIAEAIKNVHAEGGPSLKSFSMSYSPDLKDEGVFNLVKTLPTNLTEIGLVRCGVGDKGGEALIE